MSPELIAQLHPKIVHFPIALFFLYALFETAGVFYKKEFIIKAATVLLALGVVSAMVALYTGNQALNYLNIIDGSDAGPVPMKHLSEHEDWATITTWFFAGLLVLRVLYIIHIVIKKKWPVLVDRARWGFAILAVLGCYFVFRTGQEGGEEVYKTTLIQKIMEYEKAVRDSSEMKAQADTISSNRK